MFQTFNPTTKKEVSLFRAYRSVEKRVTLNYITVHPTPGLYNETSIRHKPNLKVLTLNILTASSGSTLYISFHPFVVST